MYLVGLNMYYKMIHGPYSIIGTYLEFDIKNGFCFHAEEDRNALLLRRDYSSCDIRLL